MLLWLVSSLVTGICVAGIWHFSTSEETHPWGSWISLGFVALLAGTALFTVRGYALEGNTLLVHRLFWSTRIPLGGLLSATYRRKALCGALRTFGNGGAFSFSGWYWSACLGHFHAYVTDSSNTVILRFPRRTLVVSPDRPQEFARDILAHART